MIGERWNRQWQLFNEALELPPQERSQFLDNECSGEETLKRGVEGLLSSYLRGTSFLENTPVDFLAAARTPTRSIADLQHALQGTYQLVGKIGGGGMGEVYLARHRSLGGKWAIKVLASELAQNPSVIQRFQTEARIGANLQHPNIVKVFDIGQAGGFHYLVMNYVEGEDLTTRIARKGAMTESEVVSIAIQICMALECAHDHGITHRDLKPSNVRIDNYGTVVVLDFGIARVRDAAAARLTRVGQRPGTPLYMSPEQVEGLEVDHRSDFYSLGVILYELASGSNPFDSESPAAAFRKQVHFTPPPLHECAPSISRGLSEVASKLTRKSPDERYQSASEVLSDLKNLGISTDIRTPPSDTSSEDPRRFGFDYDDRLVLTNPLALSERSLTEDEKFLVGLVDGTRSISELAALSPLSQSNFERSMRTLLQERILEYGGPLRSNRAGEQVARKRDSLKARLSGVRNDLWEFFLNVSVRVRIAVAAGITFAALAAGINVYQMFGSGVLLVDASPYAEVLVQSADGVQMYEGPTPVRLGVSSGSYLIELTFGLERREREIGVGRGELIAVREEFWREEEWKALLQEYLPR